jgi:cytochrome c-type biogenesis protein CcmF
MIPELGHFLLWLALGVTLALGVVPLWGAQRGNTHAMTLAQPLTLLFFLLSVAAIWSLGYAFVQHDFSVKYVANHSNSALPLAYRVAGIWGGHEGSLLLWILMLGLWMQAVSMFRGSLPTVVLARILAVMGLVSAGFLLFTLFTSNPFERLWPAPADGRDLNPLLQDPGMVLHPPMLYMGYVGFTVAFAFAIAALIGGTLDAQWARWTRPWTTAAWVVLTLGIALGSWWAYYELGWGGWWFWDPVENASFMPWLVGTALIHSLAVTEKRGSFKNWTVLLAILAFSLSLMGTFLVRSGVLSSVHAFATDPARGLFILVFLVVVIGASLALYAWRAPSVGLGARFGVVSRESFLLGNNVLLVAACGAVLLGTLYPLLIDALNLGKLSVGAPYFDAVFVPLMVPVVFLMGVGPLARWKDASVPELAQRLRWAAVVAVVMALITGWMAGEVRLLTSLGLAMGWWIVASVATDLWEKVHPRPGVATFAQRLRQVPRATVGMMMAHLGVAAFIFGVTLVKGFEVERDVSLAPGQSVSVGDLTFTFKGTEDIQGPNYVAARGAVTVSRGGQAFDLLHPEKRIYRVQTNPMTEAAIRSRPTGDLYVSLGEPVDGGKAWIVRVYVKPFVTWIWGGCVLMALGGAWAATDRRYRQRSRSQAPELAPGLASATARVG